MIIDLDYYKDFFELYKFDVYSGKSDIPDCLIKTNFSNSQKSKNSKDYFSYKIEHKFKNIHYSVVNFILSEKNRNEIKYQISDSLNTFQFEYVSQTFLSFDEIQNIFNSGIEFGTNKDNSYGIPMGFHFGFKFVDSNLGEGLTYTYKSGNAIEYFIKEYGKNCVVAFKTNSVFMEPYLVDKNSTELKSHVKYFFHVKYNDMWFKIISHHSNIARMILTNYKGDFLKPETIDTTKNIEYFVGSDVINLFDENLFNSTMEKVESELIFS